MFQDLIFINHTLNETRMTDAPLLIMRVNLLWVEY
jgi:hypothetical protein